ncbi:MAG: helix-turn-helix domain-containing protein, partial [Methanosarcinaceae archaeon]
TDSKLAGLETGADDYITKPFNIRELKVRIKNLIEQRRRLRERFRREVSVRPKDIAVTSTDEKFLQRAISVVDEHIADSDFSTETLARKIGLSRSQLHRKLTALTDQTALGFMRIVRLRRAAQLLKQKAGNVTEIAYMVGFNNISHFAKRFRELFGVSPSEYAKL